MNDARVSIPASAQALTAEWATAVLTRGGTPSESKVEAVELEPLGEPGQTGEIVRLALHGEDVPASIVVKLPAIYPEARAQMQALGLYEREVRFYRELGPDAGIPLPRVYFADFDPHSGDFVIAMEDMSDCRTGSFYESSPDDVEQAVDALAAFHARWWNHPRLSQTAWLRKPDDKAYFGDMLGPLMRAFVPLVAQKYAGHFTGYIRDAAYRMMEGWDRFWPEESGAPRTLVHGDYHPKQLFFPGERAGRFAVFDWQSVAAGGPELDLHRVMVCGLSPADLRRHRERLIERFGAALRRHGIDYPLEALQRRTRRAMLWTLAISIFALATTDESILRQAAEARGVSFEGRAIHDLAEVLEDNAVHEFLE